MASNSVSLHKAQVPLSCHFCNESTIQWKCEDCGVFMCTSCKENIHQRLKSAPDHDIVSVSDMCIDNPPQREVASEVITSVFNSYTTTVPAISSLLCSGDDVIYFLNHKLTEVDETVRLAKGKMLKSSIRIMQTLDKRIFDIAVNKEGEILFNEFSNNDVCILAHLGETKVVLDTSPMKSLALHVNKDNEIIIGIREQGQAFPVKDFSIRQILIFDNDYKRKMILETDTKGRKLFNYPARIKTDSKKVLYVAEWMEKVYIGRLVAIDINGGRLKFTYNGNQDLSQSFCPN